MTSDRTSAPPQVQIQVVVHKSQRWWKAMAAAVDLLGREPGQLTVRIWDNDPGSTFPDGPGSVRLRSPWSYHPSGDGNIGFGAAHNRLAEMAPSSCSYLLLLNPDTIPFFDSLGIMLRLAADHPKAALVEACQSPVEHPKQYDPETCETNWCSAACLLVRLSAFRQLGGFDRALHLYCEDVDLSWRAWLGGWSCLYAADAKCVHVSSRLDPHRSRAREILSSAVGDIYLRRKYFGEPAAIVRLRDLGSTMSPRFVDRVKTLADALPVPKSPRRADPHLLLDPPGFYGPRRW
jgi:GT2 family glycosyltransferase